MGSGLLAAMGLGAHRTLKNSPVPVLLWDAPRKCPKFGQKADMEAIRTRCVVGLCLRMLAEHTRDGGLLGGGGTLVAGAAPQHRSDGGPGIFNFLLPRANKRRWLCPSHQWGASPARRHLGWGGNFALICRPGELLVVGRAQRRVCAEPRAAASPCQGAPGHPPGAQPRGFTSAAGAVQEKS